MNHKSALVKSMTAFARVEGEQSFGGFSWELRSVNHRYLEPSFRLPEKFRAIEPRLRERLRKHISRGKIECALQFRPADNRQALTLDQGAIEELLEAVKSVQAIQPCEPLSAAQILQWPGVIAAQELELESVSDFLLEQFDLAVGKLLEARAAEGQRLQQLIEDRLAQIGEVVEVLRTRVPEILIEHQAKIESRLADMSLTVEPDRLAAEIVLLAQKTDIAEELDRLEAHVEEVSATMAKSGPCGRRLDFLMQELNREANTLGSKSVALDTSQGAVNLKVLIEQMREQVQNIE